MHSRCKICCSALLGLLFLSTPVRAQSLGRTEVFLSSAGQAKAMSLYSSGFIAPQPAGPGMDYALFATELVAYLTKEVLPDSPNEYENSLLGSRLSRSMPDSRSEFGSHCLTIVTRLGSALPYAGGASNLVIGGPSTLAYVARAATAGLALRQIWSAFQNDVEGNRTGVSLNPKVGSRRIGVNVTLHW